MQERLSPPIEVIQRQIIGKYWSGVLLNGAATLFLDDDQLSLVKSTLVLFLPLLIIYTKVKISELAAFLQMIATTVSIRSLCSQECGA